MSVGPLSVAALPRNTGRSPGEAPRKTVERSPAVAPLSDVGNFVFAWREPYGRNGHCGHDGRSPVGN